MNRKPARLVGAILVFAVLLSLAPAAFAEDASWAYTASFTDVDLTGINVEWLTPAFYTDEGIFATSTECIGQDIPEGVVPEYEGQYDVYEQRLVFIGYDGSAKLVGYEPFRIEKEPEPNQYGYTGTCYGQSLLPMPDGGFAEIAEYDANWCTLPGLTTADDAYWENSRYAQEYYLRFLDPDGREKLCVPIPVEEYGYVGTSASDGEGNIFCSVGYRIVGFNALGQMIFDVDTGEYIDSLLCFPDGSLFVSIWGQSGQELCPVSKTTGELGRGTRMPGDAYSLCAGGGDYPLYYSSGNSFYGFSLETGERVKLFNWLNLDVASEVYGAMRITEDGTVIGMLNDWDELDASSADGQRSRIFTVKRVPASEIGEKTVLTLASQWLSYDKRNAVLQFNRQSDAYRIEVLDYSEYNTEDDYSAGLMKLQTEVMAGTMPDLLDLEGLPIARFTARGLLVDLMPYIEADEELRNVDFFPNVLEAAKHYGKLVSTVPGFSVSTLIGASSVVGDRPGWTYADFNAALARMPAGCRPLSIYTTRGDILETCLGLDIDNYVNWETGECRFGQDYIDLLNFVNRFPAYYDWALYDYGTDSDAASLASGQQMLAQTSVYNAENVMYDAVYFGGQPYTYIGYPTNSGTGNYFFFEPGIAMTVNCAEKEAAWAFLRTFFTEKYQRAQFSLPLSRTVFMEKLEDATRINWRKGANGEFLLDENGERIPEVRATVDDGLGNSFSVYALSSEEADRILDLVNTTTRAHDWDQSIVDIVTSQAEPFFQGQKTAEAVAKLTQSKVSLYVNEQR